MTRHALSRLALLLSLPLAAASCVDPPPEPDGADLRFGAVPGPAGPIWTYYEAKGDLAIVQGDMVFRLGDVELLTAAGDDGERSASVRSRSQMWPRGFIPFTIDPGMVDSQRIVDAVNHWNANTVVHWQQVAGEPRFVTFRRPADPDNCSAAVGMVGGQQFIDLGDNCSSGNAIHEMGHAAGFWHEQSRRDRDTYVEFHPENLADPAKAFNFDIYSDAAGLDSGRYDYGSIMHYPGWAFAKAGTQTLVPRFALPPGVVMGQTDGLSGGDVWGVWRDYAHGTRGVEIVVPESGKCFDVPDAADGNNVVVQQFMCNNGANQRWALVRHDDDGTVEVRGEDSGKCLDIPGGVMGTRVQQFDCHAGGNQRWRLYRQGDLMQLKAAGDPTRCIGVDSTDNRSLKTIPCTWPNTTFYFYGRPPAGLIQQVQHDATDQCIDVPWASHAPDVDVQIHVCHSGQNQRWKFVASNVNRYYRIESIDSPGLCLEQPTAIGTNLRQRACDTTGTVGGQKFLLPLTTNATFQVVPIQSNGYGTCLQRVNSGNWLRVAAGCVSGSTDAYWELR